MESNRQKVLGSPPRMRGKAALSAHRARQLRITPAYAGKSCKLFYSRLRWWDHPRVCGEKHHHQVCKGSCKGSPPRMRGKAQMRFFCPLRSGITPAYAGKRCCSDLRLTNIWDHPRVCGEKNVCMGTALLCRGSPPRMRGKVDVFRALFDPVGITPAYAGKSTRYVNHAIVVWDHPRVCGEKLMALLIRFQRQGSPPRMRGKAPLSFRVKLTHRITPAYAGKRMGIGG